MTYEDSKGLKNVLIRTGFLYVFFTNSPFFHILLHKYVVTRHIKNEIRSYFLTNYCPGNRELVKVLAKVYIYKYCITPDRQTNIDGQIDG